MKLLKKSKIERCEFQKNINLDGGLTRLRITIDGWGFLRITAKTHPNWIGIRKLITSKNQNSLFLVPKSSVIEVQLFNFFGKTKEYFKSPDPNYKFKEIPQPLTFISKSSKIENIKTFAFKPKYSSKIFTHFLRDGANIVGQNIIFKLNLKQKNQMFDIPKFKLNSNLIKQKLKESSIKP
jgi:hypothetical protein